MKEAKELLRMIKGFIEGTTFVANEKIDEGALYHLAKTHKVSNFLIRWAEKSCQSQEIKDKIQQDFNHQIIKDTNENLELELILNQFEEAGIETLMVKGIIMKEVYPQDYMRKMCDIDIMVRQKDFKRATNIMKNLGFDKFYDHEKHLVFTKNSLILVEMHRKLIPGGDVSHEYFNDIWSLCVPYKNYRYVYRMNLEDTYLFCIIHLIRHFQYAGIQIRDVLDVYLFWEKYKSDFKFERLNEKLEEFQAKEFEKKIRKIAYQWFGDAQVKDFDEVEKFILKGWSMENHVHYAVGERKGKVNYLFGLLFPEFKVMREKYPILKKVPVLLPVTWGARLLKDIFSKEMTVTARMDQIKLIQEVKQEEVDEIQRIYRKLGIVERK